MAGRVGMVATTRISHWAAPPGRRAVTAMERTPLDVVSLRCFAPPPNAASQSPERRTLNGDATPRGVVTVMVKVIAESPTCREMGDSTLTRPFGSGAVCSSLGRVADGCDERDGPGVDST